MRNGKGVSTVEGCQYTPLRQWYATMTAIIIIAATIAALAPSKQPDVALPFSYLANGS
jgi:hypothetical protein